VSAERIREFLVVFIQHALPEDRRSDMQLRDRLVEVSFSRAFFHAKRFILIVDGLY
jgi:hypothetical protein